MVCNLGAAPKVHQSNHRVVVPSVFFQGTNYLRTLEAKEGLSIGDVHGVRMLGGEEYWTYQFAVQTDAITFGDSLRV